MGMTTTRHTPRGSAAWPIVWRAIVAAVLLLPAAAETTEPAPAAQAPDAAAPAQAAPEKFRALVGEEAATQVESAASQERIDGVDDETQKLAAEYRQVKNETESLRTYNQQIEAQLPSQLEEMQQLELQLKEIEATSRDILPLMQRMLETLEQFVRLDLPFLPEERAKRVSTLLAMMDQANVTISEKFRRIVEAYQIEMEYGRTLEAYEGRLGEGEQARTVQFLRVGRVGLMYQTLDQKETGYWDANAKAWVVDNSYGHAFAKNIAVAKKLGAPDLLVVPVPAPKEVNS